MAEPLQIDLDRPAGEYHPGEGISGRVVAAPGLGGTPELVLRWRTAGDGDVDRGPAERVPLTPAAEPRSWTFDVPAPAGPPTLRGRLFQVGWVLVARGVEGRELAEAEREVVLVGATETVVAGRTRGRVRRAGLAAVPRHLGVVGALAVLAAGAAALAATLAWLDPRHLGCSLLGLTGVLTTLVGAAALPRALAARRLGPLRLEVPEEVAVGAPLTVTFSCRPPGAARLDVVRARLRATEQAFERRGKGQRRLSRVHLEVEAVLPLGVTLRPGEELRRSLQLVVPADAPASFASEHNRLEWTLALEVDLPGWPDWSVEVPVTVVPAGAPPPVVARLGVVSVQAQQRCPYCRDALGGRRAEAVSACAGCGTVLHAGCWAEVGRCPTAGCGQARPARARA